MMQIKIICILLSLVGVFSSPLKSYYSQENSCVIQKCHAIDSNKINVHLIPHSHDDVGWLKTVEEYYYGRNDSIQNVGVQYIFESVLQALEQDSSRRFIQVETAFFWKWWNKQNAKKQTLFKSFVDNGQIEMVGGGWSMNDEACTNYQSTINQFTWGLRLLNDTLGDCGRPKIGWQIDPFGHSREQASIFKQMGYNAFFFVRLSKATKDERILNADLEFLWKSSANLDDSEIFTSIFSTDSYFAPNGFCWDYLQCDSDAINNDPESFDYNVDTKVALFSEYIANYTKYYKTNNILFAMGGDFQYQAAERNYINIDRLIKGFENNPKYNVFYSTPSCYYKAVSDAKPNLTVTTTDFFPYAESNHTYWSGYYTSRATIKRFERSGNNILQAANQLNAFAKMRDQQKSVDYENNLKSMREVMGTLQHHDAITDIRSKFYAPDDAGTVIIQEVVNDIVLSAANNYDVNFELDSNNLLDSVTMNGETVKITQKFMAYISNNGTGDHVASGSYIFRPINGSDAFNIDYYYGKTAVNETTPKKIPITSTKGNLVDEVIQVFNDWLTQTIRVYKGDDNNFIEFDWLVGPLDNNTVETTNNYGREIITRFYVTDFDNEFFYTDSNGREMMERKRNNYPYDDPRQEPVTSNYFPVTSKISIQDEANDLQVAILNDRSQGGSSLWGGEIELMIHRRTLRDDSKGLDETLEEMEFGKYLVVRGQHYLVLGSTTAATNDATSDKWTLEKVKDSLNFQWSGLQHALPDNVNILSLEPWKESSYILRLEHIMAKDEDINYSKEVTVDISEIFSPYTISSIRETTLAANDWLSDTESSNSFKWKTARAHANPQLLEPATKTADSETQILLTPMQIRTFIIEVSK
ncbi:hypothetical protein NQ314_010570 [Rhamnusium bicolor]|uniref:alpha-mannosidase n=1 Tax=Rhamnusium bicolor TaxID=1586634 RepID=A0AAV8XPD5_9CUCU|nr:hypothetical protein NQ314_010570 [Rhamnusium bicolor]